MSLMVLIVPFLLDVILSEDCLIMVEVLLLGITSIHFEISSNEELSGHFCGIEGGNFLEL